MARSILRVVLMVAWFVSFAGANHAAVLAQDAEPKKVAVRPVPERPAPPTADRLERMPALVIGPDGLMRPAAAPPVPTRTRESVPVRSGSTRPSVSLSEAPAALALLGGAFATLFLVAWAIVRCCGPAQRPESKPQKRRVLC